MRKRFRRNKNHAEEAEETNNSMRKKFKRNKSLSEGAEATNNQRRFKSIKSHEEAGATNRLMRKETTNKNHWAKKALRKKIQIIKKIPINK